MSIFIYNSLTRKKEEFIPLHPPQVNIYTCGVTVYDQSHIGHARSLYIFDVLRRYLKYRGYDVRFIRNITDIDDKIIKRANELKTGWQDLAENFIGKYREDLKALDIDYADDEPRATENIPEMIKYIGGLIDKGYAYVTDSGVYFSVRKFKEYGKLSGQSIEQMLTGVRKEVDETKNDPLDFALWKKSKPEEPVWESPWGAGRPGWHIECSVMSQKFLHADTLDIHAGGRDLIFPHHENEIAQAEALTGKPFAKYWIHHGLLTINSQKMSKSLGNFVTISKLLEEHNPNVLKIFFLHTHYGHPIDFSWKKMDEARSHYKGFFVLLNSKEIWEKKNIDALEISNSDKEKIDNFRLKFEEAMNDDFNTPRALAVLDEMKSYFNILIDEHYYKKVDNAAKLKYIASVITSLIGIFGISLDEDALNNDKRLRAADHSLENIITEAWIDEKIKVRAELKQKKRYSEADVIKNELKCKGIILEDARDGKTKWKWE